jgi:GlcNAc-PI de-N-acetylase
VTIAGDRFTEVSLGLGFDCYVGSLGTGGRVDRPFSEMVPKAEEQTREATTNEPQTTAQWPDIHATVRDRYRLVRGFAQPRSTRPASIVVFAPHPDDEVIGCAGIIMQALARGARVKVVAITSGDGFPAAAAGVAHKAVDQVGPDDFFALSRFRQIQSRSALGILGGKAGDLIVLGYPDGDLGSLYDSTDDQVIRQQFTKKSETYASIQKDYHTSMHGKPAAYQRSSVLGDLVELLTGLEPTEIYVTD